MVWGETKRTGEVGQTAPGVGTGVDTDAWEEQGTLD